jgi:hypothetical protein
MALLFILYSLINHWPTIAWWAEKGRGRQLRWPASNSSDGYPNSSDHHPVTLVTSIGAAAQKTTGNNARLIRVSISPLNWSLNCVWILQEVGSISMGGTRLDWSISSIPVQIKGCCCARKILGFRFRYAYRYDVPRCQMLPATTQGQTTCKVQKISCVAL